MMMKGGLEDFPGMHRCLTGTANKDLFDSQYFSLGRKQKSQDMFLHFIAKPFHNHTGGIAGTSDPVSLAACFFRKATAQFKGSDNDRSPSWAKSLHMGEFLNPCHTGQLVEIHLPTGQK